MYETTYTYEKYTSELHSQKDIPHPYLSPQEIADSLEANQKAAATNSVNMSSINFPLFFFWHRIRTMHEYAQYNTVVSALLGSMLQDKLLESNIVLSAVLILGGLDSYENAKTKILDNLEVEEAKKQELYSDPLYGIGSSIGLVKWWKLIESSKSQSV